MLPRRLLAVAALLVLGLLVSPAACQCGAPGADLTYGEAIAGGCTSVLGNLVIDGTAILNLAALSNLLTIGGSLVIRNNAALVSLAGLEQLHTIEKDLNISGNAALVDLTALSSFSGPLQRLSIVSNAGLISLAGLGAIAHPGEVLIRNNVLLSDIGALSGISGPVARLEIASNAAIANLNALGGITEISGSVIIPAGVDASANALLGNVCGLCSAAISGGHPNDFIHNYGLLGSPSEYAGVNGVTRWIVDGKPCASLTTCNGVSRSRTRTPSLTPSRTASRTPTASNLPTPSSSASLTPSSTDSPSQTPSQSSSFSSAPSSSASSTPVPTVGISPTPTSAVTTSSTVTPGSTVTPSAAATATGSQTQSTSPTQTPTGTVVPTSSPSATLTTTNTQLATRSPSPSATLTQLPTLSATRTQTPTPLQPTRVPANSSYFEPPLVVITNLTIVVGNLSLSNTTVIVVSTPPSALPVVEVDGSLDLGGATIVIELTNLDPIVLFHASGGITGTAVIRPNATDGLLAECETVDAEQSLSDDGRTLSLIWVTREDRSAPSCGRQNQLPVGAIVGAAVAGALVFCCCIFVIVVVTVAVVVAAVTRKETVTLDGGYDSKKWRKVRPESASPTGSLGASPSAETAFIQEAF